MRRFIVGCVLLGFGLSGAMYMFFMDSLGLEGYIAWLRDSWIDLSPWVGGTMTLVYLMVFALMLWLAPEIRKNINKKYED